MKQAIAGVTVPTDKEVTVMTVWPSVAAMSLAGVPLGLILGRLYSLKAGFTVVNLGNLICLASIPLVLVLYFKRIGPFVGQRYRVTNRRIVVERGIAGKQVVKSIGLDQFDSIDLVVQAGQEWYDAGDLVFRQGVVEKFRLDGVSRPAAFRQVCLKAHKGYVGVQQALQHEKVSA